MPSRSFLIRRELLVVALVSFFAAPLAVALDRQIEKQSGIVSSESTNADDRFMQEYSSNKPLEEAQAHKPRAINISKQTIRAYKVSRSDYGVICRTITRPSSRIKQNECKTSSQWLEYARSKQDEVYLKTGSLAKQGGSLGEF